MVLGEIPSECWAVSLRKSAFGIIPWRIAPYSSVWCDIIQPREKQLIWGSDPSCRDGPSKRWRSRVCDALERIRVSVPNSVSWSIRVANFLGEVSRYRSSSTQVYLMPSIHIQSYRKAKNILRLLWIGSHSFTSLEIAHRSATFPR